LWLLIHLFSGSSSTYVPPGAPKAVVVTMFDPSDSASFKSVIKDNRKDYASRHGTSRTFSHVGIEELGEEQ